MLTCGVLRCRWAPRTRERWGVRRMMVRYAAASGLWIHWAHIHFDSDVAHASFVSWNQLLPLIWGGWKTWFKHTPHPHLSLSLHLQHQDVRKLLLGPWELRDRSICSELTRRTLCSAQPRALSMNRFVYILHTHTNTHICVCIYVFIYIYISRKLIWTQMYNYLWKPLKTNLRKVSFPADNLSGME